MAVEGGTRADAPAEDRRRELSGGTHFASLDGYRAVAAVLVVVTHVAYTTGFVVTGTLGHVLARFDFGVPLFFLMSGFLLYRPWVRTAFEDRTRPDLRRYAVRRTARILPLYWVVVVATLALLPELQPVPTQQWWVHLLGLQIYQPTGAIEGLTQTWSLCTEISFYVVLPLLGAAAVGRRARSLHDVWRRQVVLLTAMVAVSVITNLLLVSTALLPRQAGWWLPAYLDWFAAGMLLAVVEVRRRLPSPPRTVRVVDRAGADTVSCLVIAISAFAIAVTPVGGAYDLSPTSPAQLLLKHVLYLVAAFFLLLPGVMHAGSGWTGVLATSVPRRIGLVSYGIFLWHLVLLRGLMAAFDLPFFSGGMWRLLAVVLPLTIVVAAVTYRLVERPAQRWAHRL